MTTKRIVQPGALPISVGCLVQNVETFYNIGNNKPVVDKYTQNLSYEKKGFRTVF